MSEPTVEGNLGTVECDSYKAGHNVHWIPVLKKWTNEPRIPMTIRHISGNAFEISTKMKTEILFNHNPSAVIRAIKDAKPQWFKKVGNTGAITIESNRGHAWLYFSNEPFIDCETPQPKYFETYRFIDQAIEEQEVLEKNAPSIERRIQAATRILKLKQVKGWQTENKHQKIGLSHEAMTVCSCGLILDFERKINVGVGHVDY
jgi:hypothetical protein